MGEKRKIRRKRCEEIAGTCRKYLLGPVRNFGDSVDSCPGPGGEPVKKGIFSLIGSALLIAWGVSGFRSRCPEEEEDREKNAEKYE